MQDQLEFLLKGINTMGIFVMGYIYHCTCLLYSGNIPSAGPSHGHARRFFERNPETGSDTQRCEVLACDTIALLFDLDTVCTKPNATRP